MIESLFYFYVFIAVAVFLLGAWGKTPMFISLSSVLFIILGAILMTGEAIELNEADHFILQDYNSDAKLIDKYRVELTKDNDNLVNAFTNLFFYGGFGLLLISAVWIYISRRQARFNE